MSTRWHPSSDMAAVQTVGKDHIARGEGVHLYDDQVHELVQRFTAALDA